MAFGFGFGMSRIFSASRAFNPASLFANGEQGWWYDPSNFATLFQDAAGTTPVTAVEQPVGLQLDLSKGLVLGPELFVNGGFSSAAGWSVLSGWAIGSGVATGTSTSNFLFQSIAGVVAGGYYQFTVTVTSYTSGSMFFFAGASGFARSVAINSTGTFTYRVRADTAGQAGVVGSSFTGTIDNISVKEVAGNHRFQTTSANRPVVSARVNLLTKTEQLTDAVWTKTNVTVTANATTAPNGTTTADLITFTGPLSSRAIQSANISVISGQSGTKSIFIKNNGIRFVQFPFLTSGSQYANFDLVDGVVTQTSAGCAASISPVGDGWFRCTATVTYTSTGSDAAYIWSLDTGTAGFAAQSVNAGGVYAWGADFRPTNQGVGLPAYQRVNTSTDYDSTGFPTYIKPNGSNQFMVTNSINFTATDKMTVWQGVRKLSDAGTAMIAELSVNGDANNGTFQFDSPDGGGAKNAGWYSKGTANAGASTGAILTAPITFVGTGIGDISGDVSTIRINGAQVTTTTANQGTGNYGNYPAYFYARGGTSLFFNGHDYESIARGAASTTAQITAGETYINSKTKAF